METSKDVPEKEARKYRARLNKMFLDFGFDKKKALLMINSVYKLGVDLASFNNTDIPLDLESVIKGMHRTNEIIKK